MKRRARLCCGGCAVAMVMALMHPAGAQTMPAAPTPPAASDGAAADPAEIIITAQSVPVSITAVSGETLRAANGTTLANIQRIAPGLTIPRTSNNTNQCVTIRGLGSSTSGALEPSVTKIE